LPIQRRRKMCSSFSVSKTALLLRTS